MALLFIQFLQLGNSFTSVPSPATISQTSLSHPADCNGQLTSLSPANHSPTPPREITVKASFRPLSSLPLIFSITFHYLRRADDTLNLTLGFCCPASAGFSCLPSPSLARMTPASSSDQVEKKGNFAEWPLPTQPPSFHESKSGLLVMFLDPLFPLIILSLLGMFVQLTRVGTRVSVWVCSPLYL